eukprot:TRINITY_DN13004_c0_g1_i1.p1 TRINITY_DN13004_c0_g1~~TRINITY_DN13004_c0_g1_i1.p1  ORF type:complete len:451 (-),score=121.75 TRINITY_DN13004_c0_g1_i1:246-1577(-)
MTYNGASLANFYIWKRVDTKEGQEYKKLRFFHPRAMPIEDQVRYVGLSEGLINFTGIFSPDKPLETMHTEKHTTAFFAPEDAFRIAMTVSNPSVTKVKDGKTVVEFKENELDDLSLRMIVMQIYRMFKFFNGTFLALETQSEETLTEKLKSFLNPYLASLKFDEIDIFNSFEGIHFLPVDKNVYLRIQCFINLTESTFPKIQNSVFLYKDHLIWSGVEQDDMRSLYRYWVNFLSPMKEKEGPDGTPRASILKTNNVTEGFLTGPDPKNLDAEFEVPKIWVGKDANESRLVIYMLHDVTCFLMVEDVNASFFKNLGSFISHQIDFLAPILEENYFRKQSLVDDQYKYIYFNHMNCALKTSLKEKGGIARDVLKMLNDIHSDFENSPENLSEILVRTQNDKWIVGRKSDQREFYVIFEHKNSHLIEINEEVRKLSSAYFYNIFID